MTGMHAMTNIKLGKIIFVSIILLGMAVFYHFDLGQYLSLEYLKASQAEFQAIYREHPIPVLAAYAAIYITATALSLPGAVVLTLAGGGLFGLTTGTVIVSFASTIGATLACAVARFLLRDWVQRRFAARIGTINEGIAKEGAFYLFSLRLVPVFPFFLINLAMGLTPMRLATFAWVSQLGMLPATIVYVNAGRELARLDSLAGIMSPGLVLSFAALGLFPLAAKKLLALYRSRRDSAPRNNEQPGC